jgi:hypothetical protein
MKLWRGRWTRLISARRREACGGLKDVVGIVVVVAW